MLKRRIVAAALLAALSLPTQAFAQVSTTRLGGTDRYETMSQIVSAGFNSNEYAVIATGSNYPDALVASGLAGTLRCPIILTSPDRLSAEARSQLDALGVEKAYIVGGTSSVSDAVSTDLASLGITVIRVAGVDRCTTSIGILHAARDEGSTSNTIIIATGDGFADALSIGPWAWYSSSPILLARDGLLTDDEVLAIRSDSSVSRILIVGGTAAVSEAVRDQLGDTYAYTRLDGSDRYATGTKVADWASMNGLAWSYPAVATGLNYPDALAGAALQGARRSPILLVSDSSASSIAGIISSHEAEISSLSVLGGESSVSPGVEATVSGGAATQSASSGKQYIEDFERRWSEATTSHEQDGRNAGTSEDMMHSVGDYVVNLEGLMDELYAYLEQQPAIDKAVLESTQADWSTELQSELDAMSAEFSAHPYSGYSFGLQYGSVKAEHIEKRLSALLTMAKSSL